MGPELVQLLISFIIGDIMGKNGNKTMQIYEQYLKVSDQLEKFDFNENKRKEIAKRLNISVQQADRYKAFSRLIPEVQNLVRDYNVGMSSLLKIVPYPAADQRIIYSILLDAQEDGFLLTRSFVEDIIELYQTGKKSWLMLKPYCNSYKKRVKREKKSTTSEKKCDFSKVFNYTGSGFEYWVADLLKAYGFSSVFVTQHSYDGGKDITAQREDIRYIFQCKKSNHPIGVKALQEIRFAKKPSDQVAVVVTNSRFTRSALEAAQVRGILCWNGKKLCQMAKMTSNVPH